MESIKGSFAQLECLVSGSLPITVTWFKENKEIETDEKHKCIFFESAASLEISHLDSSDSGNYTCIAKNQAGTVQCSGTLKIKGLRLPLKPESQDVIPGSRVQFNVLGRVAGSQPLTVNWYKDGTEIFTSDCYDVTFKTSLAVLCIKKSQLSDSGTYMCKISNEAGTASYEVSVKITGIQLVSMSSFSYFLCPVISVLVKKKNHRLCKTMDVVSVTSPSMGLTPFWSQPLAASR
uniref:Ig-like domain-containing protein n=1 Tax=Sinocyclocheilus anshuiensis TaxID=1608454 RepID=A0A671SBX7_9TELE